MCHANLLFENNTLLLTLFLLVFHLGAIRVQAGTLFPFRNQVVVYGKVHNSMFKNKTHGKSERVEMFINSQVGDEKRHEKQERICSF